MSVDHGLHFFDAVGADYCGVEIISGAGGMEEGDSGIIRGTKASEE